MGFDKPDLGFVVHYQRPGSAIAYYQQVGRAGRAVEHAYGVLLSGREDDDIAEYFMDTAFPPTADMHRILEALEGVDSMTATKLEQTVNLRRGRIAQALKLLEIDGAVGRDGSRYRRTAEPWAQDEERIARVVAARRAELEQMQAYMREEGCLMAYLVRLLDDPDPARCGRCANCTGERLPREVDDELVRAAISYLRRDLRGIKPRAQWPPEAVPGLSGRISPPNLPGMALSVYGDAGWGRDVQRGRVVDKAFDRVLVDGAVTAIQTRWRPQPEPEWLTFVPSASRPGMIEAFAADLAGRLGIPYVAAFTVRPDGSAQAEQQNSAQQLRNVHDKLSVVASVVRPGPVLLVDDLVDSGWTFTLAGALLRDAGSAEVLPFALAAASARDG
jgi:ATP-dependent DNA helicase RecQ